MSNLRIYRRKDRGLVWQAQVYVGSRRHRFSCKTTHKATARKYAQERISELENRFNQGLLGLPEPVRMSEVFERYEREYAPRLRPAARVRMMQVVGQAKDWFTSRPLSDPLIQHVSPAEIQAFLELKRSEGVTPRTVNLYRANLHRVFQLCVRPWLLIPTNPVAATEPLLQELREPTIISESEFDQLRSECHGQPMLLLFATLAWETGARSSELLQLEWQDIDFERGLLTFVNDARRDRQTKGRRSRTIPLSPASLVALREHAADFRLLSPRSEYVFKHLRRSHDAEPGQRIESIYRGFKAAAKRAGMPDLRPHDLRHCFVTRKLAEGVPAQLVMRYVGHADLATTMRYTHLVPEHLRAVVAVGERASTLH